MTFASARTQRPARSGLIAAALVIVGILVAACGGGAAVPAEQRDGVTVPAAANGGAVTGQDGAQPETDSGSTTSYADLADRQIVKTGEITVEVASVATSVGEIRALALEMGGYVGGSNAGGPDDAATLTLRIPADRFDAAIDRLHGMDGKVVAEATREQDVTGQVVDLDARIRNLQASEAQYRALLNQATKIDDILTVQSRLDQVRGEIEQLQAQLDQLSNLADLATLTVTVVPAEAPIASTAGDWDAGSIFENAVAALVSVGQALASVAIWLVILGVPLALLIGLLVLVGLRVAPGMRRRDPHKAES